jgi:predicted transcriptional regulator
MLPSIESVKQQRLKIGMTQKELANQVGVSTSMINQIESGRSAPSYETAKKIFEVLEKQERDAAGAKGNAGDLCTQKIFKLKPSNTLGEAMTKMDKENNIVGIISDSGIISHMSEGLSKKTKIGDIMEPAPPVVDIETPASTLAPLIKYSKCILVRKDSKIFGIITASDTLKMME